jgi:hypothetical protein
MMRRGCARAWAREFLLFLALISTLPVLASFFLQFLSGLIFSCALFSSFMFLAAWVLMVMGQVGDGYGSEAMVGC